MARIKKKKKEVIPRPEKKSDIPLILIFFLLLIQTAFLFYKNSDIIKDMFREDPNSIYQDSGINGTEDINGTDQLEQTDPKNIRISVLNGCGIPGLAAKWKEKLRDLNFDVRETGNSRIQYDKTIILSRSKDMTYANYVAQEIGISNENVLMQLNKDLVDIDLTIIVGSDYKKFDK